MIPQKLTLKNFLSYQQLSLDFSGLHIACICGANGAGKSSLLEAITWAIWGESRTSTEDNLIHIGAKEAQVDLTFWAQGELYRVIRTRPKGSAGSLEFQIKSEDRFRSLTERGIRATQQVIINHVKIDYDTFVNSAYLRQGKADEFMLKRPSDRKSVLAEMLNLGQYDYLTERAKDIARACKGEITALESTKQHIQTQITAGAGIEANLERLQVDLIELQTVDQEAKEQLQILEQQQRQRQTWLQQLNWQQQQSQQLQADQQRLQKQLQTQQQQIQSLESTLQHREAIARDYANYQQLAEQEAISNQKLAQYQKLQGDRNVLATELASQRSELNGRLRHLQAQLESVIQQKQDLQAILTKAPEIDQAIAQLQQARIQLHHVEDLQAQSAPLTQRAQVLQRAIDQEAARLNAQLDQIQKQRQQLIQQCQSQPQLLDTARSLDQQIRLLEKKQVYQERVHEKGLERRDFLQRLQERMIDCEGKLQKYLGKIHELHDPNIPCPLCDRPLDQTHWQLVKQKQEAEYQELQQEKWLIKEQQAASECEIQVLREEYRHLMAELAQLPHLLQQKGNLAAQLQAIEVANQKLGQTEHDLTTIQACLQRQAYDPDSQEELQMITAKLAKLNYDDKNLALARGDVERWRWSEVKLSELKNARRQDQQLAAKIPEFNKLIQQVTNRLETNTINLELQQNLEQTDRALIQLAYNPEQHQQLRGLKEKAQPALLRSQELHLAQQQYPTLQQQYHQTQQLISDRQAELQTLDQQTQTLQASLQQILDRTAQIQEYQTGIKTRRSQMDYHIGEIGRLQAAQQQRLQLIEQEKTVTVQIQGTQKRQHIHQELQQAFGKNGIQALMIETILPQIEAEANHILAALSNHQFHVRFITQKAGKKADKVIDTLEIEIADSNGTRPYETYSGGEAFRINFAIRLALSRVLAQRFGGTLQTLIIDEGFGTQDTEGCDRLLSAINAIAPDFACILVITHMPQLKEAFTTLIEVTKSATGSSINFVV